MLKYILKFIFRLLLMISQTSVAERKFKSQDNQPVVLNETFIQPPSIELN